MNILAIDTSSSSMSVCVMSEGVIKGEINLNNGLVHSTTLMPCIEDLFKVINFDKKTLDMIAVCVGPGSFTGIRIGVATANAMSMAFNIPVVSVITLDALAMNFLYFDGIIISTVDAQRDNFYVGVYKSDGNRVVPVRENEIMSDEELTEYILSLKDKVILSGDAVESVNVNGCIFPNTANNFIRTSNVAVIGEIIGAKDKNFANPVYMRKSQAEIVYEQKHKDIE
ncbi:tRNA (adenosine(37)-N6)-threonylcarbamoyltransferase complex dimerization subunit type 1 TsaB [Peptoanaerobacter stomatis]|uniref:Gcp-like domain-containing protein n=1 Tax=Peptoanaerobacter stomatis TaxID=796937 RepID=G9WXU2_9FIRM|nr:tRNA (adenosine(37)-N6)-threonylcarbamoyltransferase complex dimerization subunit type 1 TsaB [Peptoanaerobacter stomatis]EHL16939.1 hypothetical protein HMPREF9629_00181 [Peptoanaerobacter stomatis]